MFHRPKEDQSTETDAKENKTQENNKAAEVETAPAEKPVTKPANETEKKSISNTETKSEETSMAPKQDQQNSRPGAIPGSQASSYQPAKNVAPQTGARSSSHVGGYPGASSSQASSFAPQAANSGEARRLIIGQGITMSGEIEACDYLLVEGTVEAALKGASVLEIAESGMFYGTVEIEEATVSGRFEGDITVSGRLTVTSTGSITGSISYGELSVEGGASLDGSLSPLATNTAKSQTSKTGSKKNSSVDETSEQLPFANNEVAAA